MQCPFCDREVEDLTLGICSRCAMRYQKPCLPQYQPVRRDYLTPVLAAASAVLLVATIGFSSMKSDLPTIVSENASEIRLTNTNAEATYSVGPTLSLNVRALFLDKNASHQNFLGYSFALGYLTEEDYGVMQTQYTRAGRCPASFLNSRAMTLGFVIDNEYLVKQLKGLDIKEGDRLELRGEDLKVKELRYRGLPAQFSGDGKFRLFRLQEIRKRG